MEIAVKWTVVVLMLFGTGVTVGKVGQKREPITSGQALFSLIVNVTLVAGIVYFWDTDS